MKKTSRQKVRERQQGYQLGLKSVAAQRMLQDLAEFCRAHESTFHENPRIAAMLDGRREVWLRIMNHVKLTEDQLFAVLGGVDFKPVEDDHAEVVD